MPRAVLVKPTSAECNMACRYCFYRDRPTDPYRGIEGRRMDERTLRALISQHLAANPEEAVFSWQGGEPLLMGLDFFKRAVELEMEYGAPGQRVGNAVQTNGTLLTREWARFFADHNFLVGLSLDGPKHVHDRYRRAPDGRGSFDAVMRAADILREEGAEFNVLAVVTNYACDRAEEIYGFFVENGFRYLQFIPCVERDPKTGKLADFSVRPDRYARFLCDLFDLWFNGGSPEVSIRFFDNVLLRFMGMEAEMCELAPQCGSYLVVEFNGDVYPCDFFVREEWRLGNIHEAPLWEIARSGRAREFFSIKLGPYPECERCEWNFICRNGCPRYRFVRREDFRDRNYLCPAHRKFFEHSADRFGRLAERLKSGGPPGALLT